MAERAHPDDPAFRRRWVLRRRGGWLPWLRRLPNPYLDAFLWRYRWVSSHALDKDVLDVPCGMGWGTSRIRGARSITGVDLHQNSILEAHQRYGRHAQFWVGDMRHLDFPRATFDLVACLEGIEHVPVAVGKAFLEESLRVLRPDGQLLLSSPYCRTAAHSGNPHHLHEYAPAEIESLLQPDWSIEERLSREVDNLTVLYLRCRPRSHA
ncbi:MAG: class I SAM-dependent methyltransferase [Verrucomicrobiae bacterium]|nr:class I SAM-dependent methyltransferase [Verrucomicrobiae bacterium]